METERILFVDDEAAALEGYRRILYKDFALDTAVGPAQGLIMVSTKGPYAVIISDMRMPEMDGARFLAKAREVNPDTVRIAITGYADLETAGHAINEGRIFRFLTKPCEKETLMAALNAGLEQYRLVNAEKQLLEKTLKGSVHILSEMMGLVNPAAFSHASRIAKCTQHLVKKMKLPAPWRYEVAAMLSQLGCVTLDTELQEAYYGGAQLEPKDQTKVDGHPAIAAGLLANIPRLEEVAWMIAHQNTPAVNYLLEKQTQPEDVIDGARILCIAVAYDRILGQGHSHDYALDALKHQPQTYDTPVVEKLQGLHVATEATMEARNCKISELRSGMVLRDEVRTSGGLLVVAKGQEITSPLLMRLKNFYERKAISEVVGVLVPHAPAQAGQ